MKRMFILLCVVILASCQDKVICPAFQSTYILDDSTRNAYFSYVWQLDENTRAQFLSQQKNQSTNTQDSASSNTIAQPRTDYYAYAGEEIVPWRVSKRTKYGIVKPTFGPIKNYRMRTAPMVNVLGPEPISNEITQEEIYDSISTDTTSLNSDSLLVASEVSKEQTEKTKYLYGYDPSDNFNVEQYYYNKYFASQLVDSRPEPLPREVAIDTLGSDSIQTKEPFFKNLFKKKTKDEVIDEEPEVDVTDDEEAEANPQIEEEPSSEGSNE